MEQLEFDEIVELLNKTRTVRIGETPTKREPGQWSLYTGEYVLPAKRIPFEVLYLYSRATRDGAVRAKKIAFRAKSTQVVYATSLEGKVRFHRDLFQLEAESFLSLREYLASFLREEMHDYVRKLSELETKFYVDPMVETPIGANRRVPNPLEQLLIDDSSEHDDGGIVGVLLAEPGQGKTFMCDHLVSRIAERAKRSEEGVTPIYVAADQWKVMPAEDLSSIWKTLGHSFRHYDAPIGWLENSEDIFLRVTLKAGLFRLVFDGFDEYILRNKGEMSAVDVLKQLSSLAAQTGTTMLVTARTTFWEAEVKSHLDAIAKEKWVRSVRTYAILPFDRNQATKYFELRFKNSKPTVTRATTLFDKLAQKTEESFAGRGFVLRLIADLFERDPNFSPPDIEEGPTWWLMTQLCERERLRQGLPLSAEQQLVALTEFVKDVAKGQLPTSSTLEAAVFLANSEVTDAVRTDCMKRMVSHPIINLTEGDQWRITEDQAALALLAHFVRTSVRQGNRAKDLDSFSELADLEPGAISDLAGMLAEDASDRSGSHENAIRLVGALRESSVRRNGLLPRLGFQTAIRYVESQKAAVTTKSDRSAILRKVLGDDELSGLICSGNISKFDFRAWTFRKCTFINVRWTDCIFDSETVFDTCEFRGGGADYCHGFGESRWRGETGDQEGLALIRSLQVESGTRTYSDQDLRDDLATVLRKFIPRAGYSFKTIRKDHLNSGVIRRSRFRVEIVDEVSRHVLKEHAISGVTGGGLAVREECVEAMRFFAQNNVFTGPLEVCFEKLKRRVLA